MVPVTGVPVGVVGGRWRGRVTPWGALVPDDGSPTLDWWVAAEDRWHTPATEPSLRQRMVDGVPVVETSVRVPGGDAVQRTYAVADDGGLTVVEVENRSPASFALVLGRRDLLTTRPAGDAVPAHGGDAPADALVLPVGHRTTVRVALAHDGRGAGPLPTPLPTAAQVARGWLAQTGRSVDLRLPAVGPTVSLPTVRSALLLDGPDDPETGPGFLVGVAELGRLGAGVDPWVDEVVVVAEALGRRTKRAGTLRWTEDAGLDAAWEVLERVDALRAARDVAALRRRLPPPGPTPIDVPEGVLALAWAQRRVVAGGPDALDLVPAPFPPEWEGHDFEAYGVPVGPLARTGLGLAVRWHGRRPALLWELDGPPVTLRCSGLDTAWSSTAARGEALLEP
jgi:hypothetical protein